MKAYWQEDRTLQVVIERIGADYEVLEYLGGGGFSKIYHVRYKLFDEHRALKIMDIDYLLTKLKKSESGDVQKKLETIKKRFVREAKIFYRISHPNIAKLHDAGLIYDEAREIEVPFLVVDYIDGESLKKLLKKESPLDFEKIYALSGKILSAMAEIHQRGIIHRDINPDNIMIEKKSGEPVLIDFGLAKETTGVTILTGAGDEIGGTLGYMPPEQYVNLSQVTPAADIYSFGAMLFHMMTGEAPMHALQLRITGEKGAIFPGLREYNPGLPGGVEQILAKSLAKKAAERYQTASEVLEELTRVKEVEENAAGESLAQVLNKIGDTYKVQECLSKKGLSYVYSVMHQHIKSVRVLEVRKQIPVLLSYTGEHEKELEEAKQKNDESYFNEAQVLEKIKHPNIMKIYEADRSAGETGTPYIIREYIAGQSLKNIIQKESPLGIERALSITLAILAALEELHGSQPPIFHLDIHPDNIMIDPKTNKVVLIDFSHAQVAPVKVLPSAYEENIGSHFYISPERLQNGEEVEIDGTADFYSLGVTLYEMITGVVPYEGSREEVIQEHREAPIPDVKSKNTNAGDSIKRIIDTAMAKKPQDRYRNTAAFSQAVREALDKHRKQKQEGTKYIIDDPVLEDVIKEIGSNYEVIKQLAEGGFGKVFLTWNKSQDSLHALKIMKIKLEQMGEDAVLLKNRFWKETKLLAQFRHKNIVKILDIGSAGENELPYFIMEYIKGPTLKELIKREGRLNINRAIKILDDILSALTYLHADSRAVVHQNITPFNILLEEGTGRAVLIDFILAKQLNKPSASQAEDHQVNGSPNYMSPEQFMGANNTDARSDIYSLGVVFFQMVTGKVPFTGKTANEIIYHHLHSPLPNLMELNPALPSGVEKTILRAMAKDPAIRFQSAPEFLDALVKLESSISVV